jgi:hypothetical protein
MKALGCCILLLALSCTLSACESTTTSSTAAMGLHQSGAPLGHSGVRASGYVETGGAAATH